MSCDLVTIYMTADSEDVAVHVSTALIKERLVACANITSGMRSIYEWDGVLQLENELTVLMKTTKEKSVAAVARAKELHTYDVPCLTVIPCIDADEDYAAWVKRQTEAEEHKNLDH